MMGILMLFTENQTTGARDSEKFVNTNIKTISINMAACQTGCIQKVWFQPIFGNQSRKDSIGKILVSNKRILH